MIAACGGTITRLTNRPPIIPKFDSVMVAPRSSSGGTFGKFDKRHADLHDISLGAKQLGDASARRRGYLGLKPGDSYR
jgi:hypothetical protein